MIILVEYFLIIFGMLTIAYGMILALSVVITGIVTLIKDGSKCQEELDAWKERQRKHKEREEWFDKHYLKGG